MFGFEWRAELVSGQPPVDEEHRLLFERVGALFRRRAAADTDSPRRALAYLSAFVRQHFAEEEQAMVEQEYPYLRAHKRDHAQIMAWVERIRREVERAPTVDPDVLEMTNRMLGNLLVQHTHTFDKDFAETETGYPTEGEPPKRRRGGSRRVHLAAKARR